MRRRQLIWLIPIVIAGFIIAFAYPIRIVEQREHLSTEQLIGKKWILWSLVSGGQKVLLSDDTRITVQFEDDGEVSGSGGCNTFFGEYQASGEYQIFGKSVEGSEFQMGVGGSIYFGPIAQTEMACPDTGRMDREKQFFAALQQVTQFEVTSESLKLFDQDDPNEAILQFRV